jgi:predicted lipid-binding transport protein (Tim44 family)
MSKWMLGLCAVVLGGALAINDVEARRLGGGRSTGVQRNVTNAPPAQQQAAPSQQAPATQAAPAAAGSRWMPILGGLALGGILGYLFGGSGLLGILLLAALAVGAVLAFRALVRTRAQPMQYAGGGREPVMVPPPSPSSAPQTGTRANVPAGFDVNGFVRAAKLNFVKLQVANDLGQLDEIREFTTPEMFEELSKDVRSRGAASEQTDVVSLDAELVEVTTEGDKHWASVRFSGMVRETPGAAPARFEEVWNLAKPIDGSSGWLLAGIQQMH